MQYVRQWSLVGEIENKKKGPEVCVCGGEGLNFQEGGQGRPR